MSKRSRKHRIYTVDELICSLKEKKFNEGRYLDILMRATHIPEREFQRYYTWNDDHYTRNCLAESEDFELILICWEKGQTSPIHDFDSREAWIQPITGYIKEEKFIKCPNGNGLEKVAKVVLGVGDFSYMNRSISIHRASNVYEARSVSLNLYSKPVHNWNIYDEETGKTKKYNVERDSIYLNGSRVY